MSYAEKLKNEFEANKEFNQSSGSEWFKFTEGDNTFRVLAEPIMFFEKFKVGICYTDCGYQGSPRTLTWIVDRKDGKVKLAKLPYTISEQIGGLENDLDYGFTGFPMPYDITIKAVGAGTKEVSYSAPLPRPVKPVSDQILAELATKKSISEILETMKKNQKEKHMKDGTWQKEQDRKAQLKKELGDARKADPVDESTIPYPDEINPADIPF